MAKEKGSEELQRVMGLLRQETKRATQALHKDREFTTLDGNGVGGYDAYEVLTSILARAEKLVMPPLKSGESQEM
jgi:hypothetical protein